MLRSGHLIALCVLALLTLGVLMVNSAGMSVDPEEAVTVKSILLSRSTAYMGAAVVAMGICSVLPIRRLVPARLRTAEAAAVADPQMAQRTHGLADWMRSVGGVWLRLAPMWALIAGLLVVLALVYIPGIGREVNGSHRWISLPVPGLESFQPSEIAKWGMIGLLALYGARFAGRMNKFWIGLAPALAASGAVAAFIVKEDLGTGVLVAMVAGLMLLAAGARWWHMALLAPLPIAGVVIAIVTSDYRRDRLLAFLNPYEHPQTIGYHMIQSMLAVANGHVSGRGLGHGLQKFGYLPEDRTDFLFAVICEELGLAGCVLVLALFAAFLWTAMAIIRNERWSILKLAGLGVVATVGIQAVINLFVVTGLGPTKGIALPLLSSGGTGWILTAASIGLLIAMDRTQSTAMQYEVATDVLSARANDRAALLEARRGEKLARRQQRRAAEIDAASDDDGGNVPLAGTIEPKFDLPPFGAEPAAPTETIETVASESVDAPIAKQPIAALAEADDQWPTETLAPAKESEEHNTDAAIEQEPVRPTTAQAVNEQGNSSRITILSTPGQQGWLFSGAAAPMTKPRFTLLTSPTNDANSQPATNPPLAAPQIVVTDAAKNWPDSRRPEPESGSSNERSV